MDADRLTTWRGGGPGAASAPVNGLGAPGLPPPPRARKVWAFRCPNPLCDTELVAPPDRAGQSVACPWCGFEFEAPPVEPLKIVAEEEDAPPPLPRCPPFALAPPPSEGQASDGSGPAARESKASEALDALARWAQASPAKAAPAKAGPAKTAPSQKPLARPGRKRGKRQRRAAPRVDLAPEVAEAVRARRREIRRDLALVWGLALAVSAGLGAAAWIAGVPDLALGAVLFIGLAVLKTVLVTRSGKAGPPTVARSGQSPR